MNSFSLLMISAMYENGGNTTQRLLDGHPELFHYPYESQLGTRFVQDYLSSLYPLKYRWPLFPLHGTPADDYETIIDEECKVRLRTPHVSKFRHAAIDLQDDERKRLFVEYATEGPRSRGALVRAFFRATADAWKNMVRTGKEHVYVGYSPIVGVDADKIVGDSPRHYVLNIVRHPWAAYADTKKRPVPLSLAHYCTGWLVHQQHALAFTRAYPDRVFIVRYEDLIVDPAEMLSRVLAKMGVSPAPSLAKPSWNGAALDEVYPWGTIRVPTAEANEATANELTMGEKEAILRYTGSILPELGYA